MRAYKSVVCSVSLMVLLFSSLIHASSDTDSNSQIRGIKKVTKNEYGWYGGNNGAKQFSSYCPSTALPIGLDVWTKSPTPVQKYVAAMALVCGEVNNQTGNASPGHASGSGDFPSGFATNSNDRILCPAGKVIYGIKYRSGNWLDAVEGIYCKNRIDQHANGSRTGGGGAQTVSQMVGGGGGSSHSAKCTTSQKSWMLNRLTYKHDSFVDKFKFKCSGHYVKPAYTAPPPPQGIQSIVVSPSASLNPGALPSFRIKFDQPLSAGDLPLKFLMTTASCFTVESSQNYRAGSYNSSGEWNEIHDIATGSTETTITLRSLYNPSDRRAGGCLGRNHNFEAFLGQNVNHTSPRYKRVQVYLRAPNN